MSTSTTTSSSTASSSPDPTSFLNAGSSTLILALLAIGLFLGALLVMLSMRRYMHQNRRRVRRWTARGDQSWDWDEREMLGSSTMLVDMLRRETLTQPDLWDALAVRAQGDRWEEIMPISVKILYEAIPLPGGGHHPTEIPAFRAAANGQNTTLPQPRPAFLHPFRVGLRDFTRQISSLHPFRGAPEPPSATRSFATAPTPRADSDDTISLANAMTVAATAEPSHVRVALAIALPTQRGCEAGVPLYALGIGDVLWRGEPPDD